MQSNLLFPLNGRHMTELWYAFIVLLVLALWYLSCRFVWWDTRRRGVRSVKRMAWVAVAIVLPLFGCAFYLFMQILGRYLTPPLNETEPMIDHADILVPSTNLRREGEFETFKQANRQTLEEVLRDVPMPEIIRGDTEPVHANGKAHAYTTPETIQAPYQSLKAQYSLFVVLGPLQGQHFLLKSIPLRIGRGPEVGIALDADLNVSRKHAEIYEWNGRLRIRDLGSSHGILVNGVAVNDQALSPGDRITLGDTVLILRELS